MFDKFMNDENAKEGADMIGRIIGVVFGIYVVAYALITAILALVNSSAGFVATSPITPITTILIPIIVAIGIGWMFYKHMAVK